MTVPVAPLGGRIQALAGAGTNDTRQSVELAADDEKAGVTSLRPIAASLFLWMADQVPLMWPRRTR